MIMVILGVEVIAQNDFMVVLILYVGGTIMIFCVDNSMYQ